MFSDFDKDMMLDLRLHVLDKYVDEFIIVENLYMHSGKRKKEILILKIFKSLKIK